MDYWIGGIFTSKPVKFMIGVAWTSEVGEKWNEEMSWEGGLLVFLDAKDIDAKEYESFVDNQDYTVRIHRPDGTFIDRIVKGFSPPGLPNSWLPGFFFEEMKKHEIPSGSKIELPPFCIPLFSSPG
jgi:hypothetical protein